MTINEIHYYCWTYATKHVSQILTGQYSALIFAILTDQ